MLNELNKGYITVHFEETGFQCVDQKPKNRIDAEKILEYYRMDDFLIFTVGEEKEAGVGHLRW